MKQISAVVPLYDSSSYILNLLKSLKKQNLSDIELLFIDDGSRDNTRNIIEQYLIDNRDSFYDYSIVSQNNRGVSYARNVGLDIAKGQWVVFIDADDLIHPEFFNIIRMLILSKPKADFIAYGHSIIKSYDYKWKEDSADLEIYSVKGEQVQGLIQNILNNDRDYIVNGNQIKLTTVWKCYKKKFLDENNIRFVPSLITGEDAVFNVNVLKYAKEVIYTPKPIYGYMQREGSATHRYFPKCQTTFDLIHKLYRTSIPGSCLYNKNDILGERYLWSLGFCFILDYCHKANKESLWAIRREYIDNYITNYKDSISDVSLNRFHLKKRCMFFMLKKGWFWLPYILTKLIS